jgi:hypothetical protein
LIFGDIQEQTRLAHAQNAVAALTQAQREELLKMMHKPGIEDEEVERRIPITSALKKRVKS